MSGNFVIWEISEKEADLIQSLGAKWSSLVHGKGQPMNAKQPNGPFFPGWDATSDKLITESIKSSKLPKLRDDIPPHNYLTFNALPNDLEAISNFEKKLRSSENAWIHNIVLVKDNQGGWAVKVPNDAIKEAMNVNLITGEDNIGYKNKPKALIEALKIGGVSLEIYKISGRKIGDHRENINSNTKRNAVNWIIASEFK